MNKFLFIFIAMFLSVPVMAKVCVKSTATVNAMYEAMYPIGAVYISTVNQNPSDLLGFGSWEQFSQGSVLVGAGTKTDSRNETKTFAAGNTGGEFDHQMSVEEMPEHSHTLNMRADDNTSETVCGAIHYCYSAYNRFSNGPVANAGGSMAHNNLQPYVVVYMWRRVS